MVHTPRSPVGVIAWMATGALVVFVALAMFDRYREARIDHAKACIYAFSSLCADTAQRANSRNACDFEELACQQSVVWHAVRRTLREVGPLLLVILTALVFVLGYVHQQQTGARMYMGECLPLSMDRTPAPGRRKTE